MVFMSEAGTAISGLIVEPDKDVFLILVVMDKTANISRFLSDLSRCSEEAGSNILDLWTSRGELATTVLIALTLPSAEGLRFFVSCIKTSQGVKGVSYVTSRRRGLLVESWGFPVLPHTGRVLVVESKLLEVIIREGWRLLGRSLGLALFHASFSYGQELARRLKLLGLEGKDLLIASSEILRHLGFGRVTWENVGDTKASVSVLGSIECLAARGVQGFESSLVKGIVAGILGEVWSVDRSRIEVKETECVARGDEACKFEVSVKQLK